MKKKYIDILYPIFRNLREYHCHKVIGMEHIPQDGKIILALNHSLATYDISLLLCAIFQEKGRLSRPLADRLFFRFPYLKEFSRELGIVEGNHRNAQRLLNQGEIVTVAPGGMREALRPSSERYQILWEKRKGFAKLALQTSSPVVIGVCPKADDIYDVYPNPLTKWAYSALRIPLPVIRGLGLTAIPRPVKLTHFLSEPIIPPAPKENPKEFTEQVNRFHKKIIKRTHKLIEEAISHRD